MFPIVKRVATHGIEWLVRTMLVAYAAAAAALFTDMLGAVDWRVVGLFAAAAVLVQLVELLPKDAR